MNGDPSAQFRPDALFSLDGRAALVIGGGGGIGAALTQGLAAAGACVTVADRSGDRAEQAASAVRGGGEKVIAAKLDVTDTNEVQSLVSQVVQRHGSLDILINAAAIVQRAPALEFDIAAFRSLLDINVVGTFIACQAAGRVMKAAKRGAIVNFASVAGIVGYAGTPAYQASKAAVIQLTRALAIEWAPDIRVNAVAPGSVRTPMTEQVDRDDPSFRREFISRIPFKRAAEPSEIVGPVLLLCSDAGSYMTGHILTVDAGFTVQ